ncbi:hypothetical protein TKK_0012084 [Trichogramma kaykai]
MSVMQQETSAHYDLGQIEESTFEKLLDDIQISDEDVSCQKILTVQSIQKWQTALKQEGCSSKIINHVLESFQHHTISDFAEFFKNYYNSYGKLIPKALKDYLRIDDDYKMQPYKSKLFPKIEKSLKIYIVSLLKASACGLTNQVKSTHFLHHLCDMLPFIRSFSRLHKPLLCIVLAHWSLDCKTKTVMAASMCLISVVADQKFNICPESLFKDMLMEYVKLRILIFQQNSEQEIEKFLNKLSCMQLFLVKFYLLQNDTSYKIAFTYLRQMGYMIEQADADQSTKYCQDIYNWEFISMLQILSEVVSMSEEPSTLRELLHPVAQMIIAVIKLKPSQKFYPLRFHCIRMLIKMCENAGVYLPVLPLLTEVLEKFDFNRRVKNPRWSPLSPWLLLNILQAPSDVDQNAYSDSVINFVYELILEFTASQSHCCYFPDMVLHVLCKLKVFQLKCEVSIYNEKIKQLSEKIEENCRFIVQKRTNVTLSLTDMHEIQSWESVTKRTNTPLAKFLLQRVKSKKNYLPVNTTKILDRFES